MRSNQWAFAAGMLLLLMAGVRSAVAGSDAGLDIPFEPLRIRVIYSVALDYAGANDCIRDPQDLLFDIIALLQSPRLKPAAPPKVLQFELYQSSQKAGTHVSLVRDPFEGGQYKALYDGRADLDVKRQIVSLLERQLGLPENNGTQPASIRLYKCAAKECDDVLFGSFPSEEMHTRYCAAPGKGCDPRAVAVTRGQMPAFFTTLPD